MDMAQQNGTGLTPHIAGVLCYVFAPVSSVIMLLLEKENKEVHFHAWQGTLFGASFYILIFVLKIVATILGYLLIFLQDLILSFILPIFCLSAFVLWVVCVVKAYQGERWRIPVLGDVAAKKAGV